MSDNTVQRNACIRDSISFLGSPAVFFVFCACLCVLCQGITLSESGFVRITWNGALPLKWAPQQCGPALTRFTNPQLEWARFGPLATSGTQSNYDSNYWR